MSNDVIISKLARLQASCKPRVLDLFAGCGGISLGFEAAGFEMRGAVEFDPDAARSHGLNFHGGAEAHSQPIDITKTSPADLCRQLDLGNVADAFDIVVGGPPCQAFARVGRSKLREIEEHPEAFIHDPRAQLYKKYLEYVDAFQPLAVLMENVPDILNHGGQNIAEETCEVLEAKGYVCGYTLLNAAFYGVPQMRERMFLIAYRRELGAKVSFPSPSHWLVLPPGYEGTRSVALKSLRNLADQAHSYIAPPAATPDLPPAVTAADALDDLPAINARELLAEGKISRGARRFDNAVSYSRRKPSSYAELMRTWHGHEASKAGLTDHVIRYLPRDYELFARMNPGDQYPEAYAHAMEMFEERLAIANAQGKNVSEGSPEHKALKDSIVPPYDASKFPNKWRKMWRDQPARTLMAHLGKDGYSHIHYDSTQARTISVREAARLQSFPDGFRFSGTMNPAFKQIGNAVPPLMAKALATHMMNTIKQAVTQKDMADEPRRAATAVS
ncbi:DNA cytosine methyltransferase [Pseudomonas chlororaphis]|uniref:DNA cytosine methyltransferase n=2 Tax=Pseudomonas chlororaphis TaxID=587753 RepID=UPI001B32E33F|nr:DNA cytosine methyltransferase [Pseudomonas chlororaphis]MBP5089860.1 DNA cytosine methyltransferase [Pseudomonas chlororaphis]